MTCDSLHRGIIESNWSCTACRINVPGDSRYGLQSIRSAYADNFCGADAFPAPILNRDGGPDIDARADVRACADECSARADECSACFRNSSGTATDPGRPGARRPAHQFSARQYIGGTARESAHERNRYVCIESVRGTDPGGQHIVRAVDHNFLGQWR